MLLFEWNDSRFELKICRIVFSFIHIEYFVLILLLSIIIIIYLLFFLLLFLFIIVRNYSVSLSLYQRRRNASTKFAKVALSRIIEFSQEILPQ